MAESEGPSTPPRKGSAKIIQYSCHFMVMVEWGPPEWGPLNRKKGYMAPQFQSLSPALALTLTAHCPSLALCGASRARRPAAS